MPKTERKYILSRQPLALHAVATTGWEHQRIESFGAFDIQDALRVLLQRFLLADASLLAKMDRLDDKEFTNSSHRSRRYISKDLKVVYLQMDEDFAMKHSLELYGYWFLTNIGFKELCSIFSLACQASGVDGQVRQNLKRLVNL